MIVLGRMKTTTGRRFKDAEARSSTSSFSSTGKSSQQQQPTSNSPDRHRKDSEPGEVDEGDSQTTIRPTSEEVDGSFHSASSPTAHITE